MVKRFRSRSRFGKKKLFRKKSGRRSFKKKSIIKRIKRVEKVVRQRRPELKHHYDSTLYFKGLGAYPDPTVAASCFFGPTPGIWAIGTGLGDNQRVGERVAKAWGHIMLNFVPPNFAGPVDPFAGRLGVRRARIVVIQFRDTAAVVNGLSLIPYVDSVGVADMDGPYDIDVKNKRIYKILYDRKIVLSRALPGYDAAGNANGTEFQLKNTFIKVPITPHWPLIWDASVSATQPRNPVFVYVYGDDYSGNASYQFGVRSRFVQHYWRDNS
jgi:hypothetical protein